MASGCCSPVAGRLLAHINLVLTLFSGAGLAAAARLKWDPSIYIALRELAPLEYAAITVFVFSGSIVTLVLAHVALFALASVNYFRLRRAALILFAALTAVQIVVEVSAGAWGYVRIRQFLNTHAAEQIAAILSAHEHIMAAMQVLARWYPMPEKVHALIKEAEQDAPVNGYVAGGAAAALLLLQVSAVLLALLSAVSQPATKYSVSGSRGSRSTLNSNGSVYMPNSRLRLTYEQKEEDKQERAPLRTAYKNGRLVIL